MEDDTKKKAGLVCAYKDCKNKSYSSVNKFYRFPEEVERAKSWLLACCRPDLLDKVNTLHKSFRICDAHFHPQMFQKGKRRLLRKNAIPVFSENSADDDTSNSLSYNPPEEPIRASQETSSSSGITLEGIFKFLDENYPQQATASIKEQLALLDKTTKETTSSKPLKLDEQPKEVEVLVTDTVESQIKVEEDELHDEDAEAPPSMVKDEVKTENETDDEAVETEPPPLEPEAHHPIQVFFDSLARTVMQFPPPLAVRAKVDVLQVISKLELEMWHNPPDPSTSTNFDQSYYFTQKPVTENIVTT